MPSISSKSLLVEKWDLVPYPEAFKRQAHYVEEILEGKRPETVVFCSHPPVVTLGRGTRPGDVFSWKGETIEVNRGGRATYHGPSQVVMYPLIRLDQASVDETHKAIKAKDLHGFMRLLEDAVIDVLQENGISAEGHQAQTQIDGGTSDATGVWFQGQKLASIGIAVRKWVSSHGLALNLYHDPEAFQGINPCGFTTKTMVSVETLLGKRVSREAFEKQLYLAFYRRLYDEVSDTI